MSLNSNASIGNILRDRGQIKGYDLKYIGALYDSFIVLKTCWIFLYRSISTRARANLWYPLAAREESTAALQKPAYKIVFSLKNDRIGREAFAEQQHTVQAAIFSVFIGYDRAKLFFYFDVRCLPNPFYIPELKKHTGLESCVSDYVLRVLASSFFVALYQYLVACVQKKD